MNPIFNTSAMNLPKTLRGITILKFANMGKTFNIIVFIFMTNHTLINCQSLEEKNIYAFNAMNKAVSDYVQQKSYSKSVHRVLIMKVMKINKNSGEFVLSYIINDSDYEPSLGMSHYVLVENRVVLVKADKDLKIPLETYGINKVTDDIIKRAYDTLAGPNLVMTGQPSPLMVVRYKRGKIKGVIYNKMTAPKRKYWF